MREILMELELLFTKMNDVNMEFENEQGNKEIPFGKVIYAITRDLDIRELFNMTNDEFIKHVQKIQIIEG